MILFSKPTRRGTGIVFLGDYDSLDCLYNAVALIDTAINKYDNNAQEKSNILLNFLYEIRKAREESRLIEGHLINDKPMFVYGTRIVWTDMLLVRAIIHSNRSNHLRLSEQERKVISILDELIIQSAEAYDAQGAEGIKGLLATPIDVDIPYLFHCYQQMHIDFVEATKGKRRFRSIPEYFCDYLNAKSEHYQRFISILEHQAIEYNCAISDLTPRNFPDIEW